MSWNPSFTLKVMTSVSQSNILREFLWPSGLEIIYSCKCIKVKPLWCALAALELKINGLKKTNVPEYTLYYNFKFRSSWPRFWSRSDILADMESNFLSHWRKRVTFSVILSAGKHLRHPGCDSLSWARDGASGVGVISSVIDAIFRKPDNFTASLC